MESQGSIANSCRDEMQQHESCHDETRRIYVGPDREDYMQRDATLPTLLTRQGVQVWPSVRRDMHAVCSHYLIELAVCVPTRCFTRQSHYRSIED